MKSPFLPYQALDLENLNSSPRAAQRSLIVAVLAVPGGLPGPYAILSQNTSDAGI